MSDELYRTVKITLNREDTGDSRGRAEGAKPAEETEFELVSTMMLKQILESDDDQKKDQIRELAGEGDGVLACSTNTDQFKIVLDDELESVLEGSSVPGLASLADGYGVERVDESEKEEDLALVSTQLLRTIMHDDDKTAAEPNKQDGAPKEEFKIGGFNPYDTS